MKDHSQGDCTQHELDRQLGELRLRSRLRQVTDFSLAVYGAGVNGTIVNSTCGALIESGVPAIQAANVSVIPLTDRLLVNRVHPAVHWSPTPVRCQRSRTVQTARLSRAELGC